MTRARTAAATAAAALAVLLAGCTQAVDEPGARPDQERRAAGAAESAGAPGGAVRASGRVTLDVGHCWVEPVLFDGKRWGLPYERQIGWGGPMPKDWEGAGVVERVSDDRVRYTDDGGAALTFLPADAPSVRRVEQEMCD